MNTQRLITSKEAAEYCGLSVATFRSFAKRNNFRRIPGQYVYDRIELDRILDKFNKPIAKEGRLGYDYEAEIMKVKPYEDILKERKHRHKAAQRWDD